MPYTSENHKKYNNLTWSGTGKRDLATSFVGYFIEIFLCGACYNLLYNTI